MKGVRRVSGPHKASDSSPESRRLSTAKTTPSLRLGKRRSATSSHRAQEHATITVSAPSAAQIPVIVEEFAFDLLEHPSGHIDGTRKALDRLRRRLHASAAVVWTFGSARAERVLHLSDASDPGGRESVPLADLTVAIDRLRHNAILRRQAGEVSGVEELVPSGIDSFVVIATRRGPTIEGVLVVGWAAPVIPYDDSIGASLNLAAALLTRMLAPAQPARAPGRASELVDSMTARVAAIDRMGTIVAVNAAWADATRPWGIMEAPAVGQSANYLEALRRAAGAGYERAAAAAEGIEAVCQGRAEKFVQAFPDDTRAGARHVLVTATPLRGAHAGALIVHDDLTVDVVRALAETIAGTQAQTLADSLPLPVAILGVDGRLRFGNQAWRDAAHAVDDPGSWLDAVHPDDRAEVASALATAAAQRARLEVELRLQSTDRSYRWWLLTAAPHEGADGVVDRFVAACADASRRRGAERAVRQVAGKLLTAQEEERARIARDLHDDLGQQAALLGARLDTALHSIRSPRRLQHAIEDSRTILADLAAALHNLSYRLHPAKLKLLGLEQTLDSLCREIARETQVEIGFTRCETPAQIGDDSALCIYRVTQEAVQNAIKHSGARRIDVELVATAAELTLRVADQGGGFDPLSPQSAGLGLLTMRERVELAGGRLWIDAAPGRGTTIEAVIPNGRSGR